TRAEEPVFTDTLELDLGDVVPSLAGPKRPEHRVALENVAENFSDALANEYKKTVDTARRYKVGGENYDLGHGDVAIAAITSCTNTSNPSVLIAAGLVARNAVKLGLKTKPWVKTSLAPGSQVVADYLKNSGLQKDLNKLGFNIVGFGCTTCIGNSGPLPEPIAAAVEAGDLSVCGVLSGNRNFEGRINPHVKANYLASPPLVVAYALAGSLKLDLYQDPIGRDSNGQDVYLKDIWPSSADIRQTEGDCLTPEMFRSRYANVFEGPEEWRRITVATGQTYRWEADSTYVQNPPFFAGMRAEPETIDDIRDARCLALLGDSVTTDHISPAGSIKPDSPAGRYLIEHGVRPVDFNSYGARRGNHEVMMRGTFANIRIRNEMVPGTEGGLTLHVPSGERLSIYDAAMRYQAEGTPLVIVAGQEYGTGSSRDWAAKGTRLLGMRAVVAESFERIHRSNLIGMGVLPVQFLDGITRKTLDLDGTEHFDLDGVATGLQPRARLNLTVRRADGRTETVVVLCRIDTLDELDYYRHGGILHYVLRDLGRNG
ncbi:MAG: aconitate hydratase AcnA, partial [Candidatus Competibacteraceae bacterium]|nr:aconitate hydratase AcnA [Candidatus Competibacteraceae bacterium]